MRYRLGHAGSTPPAVGDIVLIHDDKPQGFWRLGQNEKFIIGQDGHIKEAVLQVSLRKGMLSTLKQPIQLL